VVLLQLECQLKVRKGNSNLAIKDLKDHNLNSLDTVIGIAASERTPYVCLTGLKYCKSIINGLAIGLCMTKDSKLSEIADETIIIETGSEGSTQEVQE